MSLIYLLGERTGQQQEDEERKEMKKLMPSDEDKTLPGIYLISS